MKTNLSIVAAALHDDPREAAQRSRGMGFAGMSFDARSPTLDLTALSGSGRREFARMLASNDQTLAAVRVANGPKGFSRGADVDRLLSRLDEVFHLAADLGAGSVTIDLGPLPAPAETQEPKPAITTNQAGLILLPDPSPSLAVSQPPAPPPDPALINAVDSALAALCELADRYRVGVALGSSAASFAALHRALTAAGCPWFGIDLDAAALLSERWTMDEVFSRLGPMIRHVRARDGIAGSGSRIQAAAIGKGSVDWPGLLANLENTSYRGWITVDPMDVAEPERAAAAALRALKF